MAPLLKPIAHLKGLELYELVSVPAGSKSLTSKIATAIGPGHRIGRIGISEMMFKEIAIQPPTALGLTYASYLNDMKERKLVPTKHVFAGLVNEIMRLHTEGKSKILVDGAPREKNQAEEFLAIPVPSKLLCFVLPKKEILKRDRQRREKERRIDDGNILAGIQTYESQTLPAVELYRSRKLYHEINGMQSIPDRVRTLLRLMGFGHCEIKDMMSLLDDREHPGRVMMDEALGLREPAKHEPARQQPAWKSQPWFTGQQPGVMQQATA